MSAAGYLAPATLQQASEMMASQPGARILAGGHTLLLTANRAHIDGALLVDLGKVKELAGIKLQPDGSLQIGAMTTIDALMQDQVVSTQYPTLAKAASWIGDAQLRNRATIGGTMADAHPESDLAALFLALDATINIIGADGKRVVPIATFYFEDRRTALKPNEILTSVNLPAAPNGMSLVYERIKHPATLYALTGVAVFVSASSSGAISFVRVAATGALQVPARLVSVEEALLGKQANEQLIANATSHLPASLTFRSDLFGSGEYRRHLLQVLTRRALIRALALSA